MSTTNGHGEAFEIGELRSTDTDELTIMHPVTGAPTTWIWTLAGPAHPKSIELAEKTAEAASRLEEAQRQAIVNRQKWKEQHKTPKQTRLENARTFAARVLDWTPARINGEDYPYSNENVVKLLLDPAYGRVYLQLLEYFTDEKSFTQRSATTSSPLPSETSN